MGQENVPLVSFNRGLISRLGLARVDIKRTAMSAEIQNNWMPRVLGSMMLRPGREYLGNTALDRRAFHIPFVFSRNQTAIIEVTDQRVRVRDHDEQLIARPEVETEVLNGSFTTVDAWVPTGTATISGGSLTLSGSGSAVRQYVYVAPEDRGVQHTINVQITAINFNMYLYVGSDPTSRDYVSANLSTVATHSFNFTPTGSFWIDLVAATGTTATIASATISGSVSTVIVNGSFDNPYTVTNWEDIDSAGAYSAIANGRLYLKGTGASLSSRRQQVTVSSDDIGIEHGLRITVERGPVLLKVGSTNINDDYVSETTLGTGTHSLSFVPNGNFWVTFSGLPNFTVVVDGIEVETDGVMSLAAPWAEGDLKFIRYDQSFDVIYVACRGRRQYKIERRGTGRSWSVVEYKPLDGPFRTINASDINISTSGTIGEITMTASSGIFRASSVGSLYRLSSVGQRAETIVSDAGQYSGEIRVTGVGSSRQISFGGFSNSDGPGGTSGSINLQLQRSIGEPGNWVNVSSWGLASSTPSSTTYNDGFDNQIVYYRVGISVAPTNSDTFTVYVEFSSGSISGTVEVTEYVSPTVVRGIVTKNLGGTAATVNWSEGAWSPRRGYPTAVAFHQGRLFWGGSARIWGSVSDAFESFDPDTEGDSGPINRSIAGSADEINFLMRLKRLFVGTESAEFTAQSSSLDEPLTPTNFNLDDPSTQGSDNVGAVKIDRRGLFVGRTGNKVFQLAPTGEGYGEYGGADLTELVPELCNSGIYRLGVQRQPDTRVHAVLNNGSVAVLISQPAEDVLCWVTVDGDGVIEDVVVLPGTVEDRVFYTVARTVGGVTVRHFEKWAMEHECQGGEINKQADSFIIYDDIPTNVIPGVGHLEGREVIIWGDGKDLGTAVVTGGNVTIPNGIEVEQAVVGLAYEARFKSAKLAYAALNGTALTMEKRVRQIGLILADTHYQGLRYGPDFEIMDDLPLVEDDGVIIPDTVWEEYDSDMVTFDGDWDTDSRVCLQAAAPRPCTVLAMVLDIETSG